MAVSPRTCFIFNPISGTNRRTDVAAKLREYYQGPCEVWATERAGHAEELARAAAQQGFRVAVAVGGDGTVNEVARGLTGSATALGIVPRGSGNGLARHLRLPLGFEAAVRVLRNPRFEYIDTAELNGQPFFCTAGLGFDAHVSRMFAEAGTRGLLTYVRVALREYRRYRAQNVTLEAERPPHHHAGVRDGLCQRRAIRQQRFYRAPSQYSGRAAGTYV